MPPELERVARIQDRRLLGTFALSYFPADVRLGDLDRRALQGFIGWLTDRPGYLGAIALRWCDLDLNTSPPRLRVRRAIVRGCPRRSEVGLRRPRDPVGRGARRQTACTAAPRRSGHYVRFSAEGLEQWLGETRIGVGRPYGGRGQ